MLTSFFKNNDIKKLKVFLVLYDQEQITLKLLASMLKESPATTKRLLSSLNNDLSVCFNHKNSQLITIQPNELISIDQFQGYSSVELLSSLYHHYLEDSVEYKIFSNIVLGNVTNVLELCVKINISQSYCYSKIKKINTYLVVYRVSLLVETFNIILKGSETDIQFFLFLMHESFHLYKAVPLSTSNKLEHLFSSSVINQQSESRLRNLMAIYFRRKKFLEYISLANMKSKSLLKIFRQLNNAIVPSAIFNKNDDSISLFYNLIIRLIIPTIDTNFQKYLIGKAFYESNDPLILPIKKIISDCIDSPFSNVEISLEEQERLRYSLMYSLTLHLCYIDCFESDLRMITKDNFMERVLDFLPSDPDPLNKPIHSIIEKHIKHYSWSDHSLKDLSDLIQNNLYTVFSSYQQPAINIMITDLDSTYSSNELKRRITNYFSTKSIRFVDDYTQAELLVTDVFSGLPMDIPVFVYYESNSTDILQKLLTMISKMLFAKFNKSAL